MFEVKKIKYYDKYIKNNTEIILSSVVRKRQKWYCKPGIGTREWTREMISNT
jgi:hypothetical protein